MWYYQCDHAPACGSTSVTTPPACGSTSVTTPPACGSTSVTTPPACGSRAFSVDTTLALTCNPQFQSTNTRRSLLLLEVVHTQSTAQSAPSSSVTACRAAVHPSQLMPPSEGDHGANTSDKRDRAVMAKVTGVHMYFSPTPSLPHAPPSHPQSPPSCSSRLSLAHEIKCRVDRFNGHGGGQKLIHFKVSTQVLLHQFGYTVTAFPTYGKWGGWGSGLCAGVGGGVAFVHGRGWGSGLCAGEGVLCCLE